MRTEGLNAIVVLGIFGQGILANIVHESDSSSEMLEDLSTIVFHSIQVLCATILDENHETI